MTTDPTPLPGVLVLTPRTFPDSRGYFEETYHREKYTAAGIPASFVQSNHSRSLRHVLRGLHFQTRKPQAKLVTCLRGRIFDVVVDVRRASPTYGQHYAIELSDENHRQLYVPAGLAHGFCVLSAEADVEYLCSDYYDPQGEGGVLWSDPALGIAWPVAQPILSAKDAALPLLRDLVSPF